MSAINQATDEVAEQVVGSATAIQAVMIERARLALRRGVPIVLDFSPRWQSIAENLNKRGHHVAAMFAHNQAAVAPTGHFGDGKLAA